MRTEALLAGAALIVASSPVRAFVCSRAVDTDGNDTGPSLTWATRDLSFALHESGTEDVAALDELDVLRNSFQVWENVQECAAAGRTSDITFHERELTSLDLIGFDFLHPERNANVLIFRDDAWPHAGQGSLIIALTTTTYSAQTGEILDADIEFNSAGFEFTIGDTGVVTDLMNTAVHEIGHILGLGHSPVSDSTMSATARDGDVDKRTLHCDDRNGLVFKYPAGQENGTCEEPACAVGFAECGRCSAAACIPWESCGFCAPPRDLASDATVTLTDSDDGLGGCGCGTGAGAGATPIALLAVLTLARRRRSISRSSPLRRV